MRHLHQMDSARQQGTLYMSSLKDKLYYLISLSVDVVSARQLVGQAAPSKKSAGAKKRNQPPASDQPPPTTGGTPPTAGGAPPAAGGTPPAPPASSPPSQKGKTPPCPLCSTPAAPQYHHPYQCKANIALVRQNKKSLPANVCSACLLVKQTNHPTHCSIKRVQRNGVFVLLDFTCPVHRLHFSLCDCDNKGPQSKVDPNQQPTPKKTDGQGGGQGQGGAHGQRGGQGGAWVPVSAAVKGRVLSAAANADHPVVFLSELMFLKGKDSRQTHPILVSFDNHSNTNFYCGEIPPDFSLTEGGSIPLALTTVQGDSQSMHATFSVELLSLVGVLRVQVVEGLWPDSASEPQLQQDVAAAYSIKVPKFEDYPNVPRLILGAQFVHLFPYEVKTPTGLRQLHPLISTFRSRLTRDLLVCGSLITSNQ